MILREDQPNLLILAGRQRGLAEIGEHTVGQRQQVDLLRRREGNGRPAGVVVGGVRVGVDADLRDGDVHMVETARWRIGHRDVQRTGLRAATVVAAAATSEDEWYEGGAQGALDDVVHMSPPIGIVIVGDGRIAGPQPTI